MLGDLELLRNRSSTSRFGLCKVATTLPILVPEHCNHANANSNP